MQSDGADLVVPAGGCMGAFPRVAHFDADGKKDLLVGRADGTVQLFRNVGTDTAPTFDGGALVQAGPAGVKSPIDVGYRATIALTDWDNDGARDLVLVLSMEESISTLIMGRMWNPISSARRLFRIWPATCWSLPEGRVPR